MDVVIYGNGAHGQDIAEDYRNRFPLNRGIRFEDDDPSRCEGETVGLVVRIIGVNDSATRRRLADRLGWKCSGVWVHRKANLGPHVQLGRHTHVNAGAFLTRCTLGDFVTVGPNATICGDVTIGDDVMIGAGAIIRNLVTIGDGATIGCGAVVVADVPAGKTMVGNPARELGR